MSKSCETIAAAGGQLGEKLGAETTIEVGAEVERHDGRAAKVRLEDVLLDEAHAVAESEATGGRVALGDQRGVDLHAHTSRAVVSGRSDDDAAIARAEVVNDVAARDAAELEHRTDRRNRRANVGRLSQRM